MSASLGINPPTKPTPDKIKEAAGEPNRQPHILLGVTGSVAAKLTPKMVAALQKIGEVQVVATDRSLYFWNRNSVGPVKIWTEGEEWPGDTYVRDQPVPHIQLGEWADILVIAPLTANTLAKMHLGLADNLLTCTYYAWPPGKPVVVAPAMNTRMWENPLTKENGFDVYFRPRHILVPPVAGKLACGTTGVGAMADIAAIAAAVAVGLNPRLTPRR